MRAIGIVPFLITIALRSYLAAHAMTRPLVVAMIAGIAWTARGANRAYAARVVSSSRPGAEPPPR